MYTLQHWTIIGVCTVFWLLYANAEQTNLIQSSGPTV